MPATIVPEWSKNRVSEPKPKPICVNCRSPPVPLRAMKQDSLEPKRRTSLRLSEKEGHGRVRVQNSFRGFRYASADLDASAEIGALVSAGRALARRPPA